MEFEVIAEFVLAVSAVLNAVVIYPVFRQLQTSEKSNMARFQLNKNDTLTDFRIFFGTTVFFFVATSIWLISTWLGNLFLNTIGSALSIIASFVPLVIFYRWWRRFE